MSSANLDPLLILLLVVLIYLVLGYFFDGLSLMIMTLPIVVPLMIGSLRSNLARSNHHNTYRNRTITPPVGLNLSVLVSVTKDDISLGESATASIPYWIILLIGIFILATFQS